MYEDKNSVKSNQEEEDYLEKENADKTRRHTVFWGRGTGNIKDLLESKDFAIRWSIKLDEKNNIYH